MEKPISLIIEETKQSLADVLNNSKLHPYIMYSVVKELYQEVHSVYVNSFNTEQK